MAQGNRFLILSAADENYALPLAKLVEITVARAIQREPDASGPVEGTIEFRGKTIPVLDLKKTLQLAGAPGTALLVVKGKKEQFGILTDAVSDIFDTPQKPVALPKNVLPRDVRSYGGILRYKDNLVLVLNEDELLP